MWPFHKKDRLALESDSALHKERLAMEMPKEEVYNKLSEEETTRLEQKGYDMQKSMQESSETQQRMQEHDMQIISAKLDTIKSMLELVNQRILSLEKHNEEREKKKLW